MSTNVDRLIGLLKEKTILQPGDITILNELLCQASADDIPEPYREDLVDVIDLLFMCGNVNSGASSSIGHLQDSLLGRNP